MYPLPPPSSLDVTPILDLEHATAAELPGICRLLCRRATAVADGRAIVYPRALQTPARPEPCAYWGALPLEHEGITFGYLLFRNRGMPDEVLSATDALRLAQACALVIERVELTAWLAFVRKHFGDLYRTPPSPPEREVLLRLHVGQRAKAMAAEMHLSEGTVRNHLDNAYIKLGARRCSAASKLTLIREAGVLTFADDWL